MQDVCRGRVDGMQEACRRSVAQYVRLVLRGTATVELRDGMLGYGPTVLVESGGRSSGS